MVGSHLLKSWSTTQKSVALSSGEAELIALALEALAGVALLSRCLPPDALVRLFSAGSSKIARHGLYLFAMAKSASLCIPRDRTPLFARILDL